MIWLIGTLMGGALQLSYTLLQLGEPTLTGALVGAVIGGGLFWGLPRISSPIFRKAPKRGAKLKGDGGFAFNVVGEAIPRRQRILSKVAGGKKRDGVNKRVWVLIEPEPNNPHDPNAVRVVLEGETVAYIPADLARAYQDQMEWLGYSPIAGCEAVICGGWNRGGGDIGLFGLKLDLAWPLQVEFVFQQP